MTRCFSQARIAWTYKLCLHRKHANETLVVFTVTRLRNTGFPDIFDEEDIDKESDTHVYIKQLAMTIYPQPPIKPIQTA